MSFTWGSVSGWWLPACLVLGLLYAWLMYRQPVQLVKSMRYILFTLRAVVVSFWPCCWYRLWYVQQAYQPQKPLVLIAQDNSESIKLFGKNALDEGWGEALKKELGNDYEVHEFHFDKGLKIVYPVNSMVNKPIFQTPCTN
jgi:hypothetical protein